MGRRKLTDAERKALEDVRRGLLRYERAKVRAEAQRQRKQDAGSAAEKTKGGARG